MHDGIAEGLIVAQNITERKRGEEELKRSREMLARTEAIAHVGSWQWDVAADTVTWSAELYRIFQLDPQGAPPSCEEHKRLCHPDDTHRFQEVVAAAVRDGTPYAEELRAVLPDGDVRVCLVNGHAEMGPDGRAARLYGSVQDITDRKRAEETLARSEREFRALADNSPDVIARYGRDHRILYMSPQAARSSGLPPEAFVGRTYAEIGHRPAELVAIWDETLRGAFATGEAALVEFDAESPAGPRHYESRVVPEYGSDGSVSTVLSISRDVTERKRAEQELARHEREFRALAENQPDVVARYDKDHRHVYVSPNVFGVSGRPSEWFIGKTHDELDCAPELARRWRAALCSAFETGEPVAIEFSNRGPSGVRTFETRLTPEFGPDGEVATVLCLSRDVTDRLRAERQAEEARQFLQSCLDALSDHVCVVDQNGVILDVNAAWREFARENGGDEDRLCGGANYLSTCDAAVGDGAEGAAEFAAGARAVLAGTLAGFEMRYTCDGPDEPRWFHVRVTRFPGDGPPRVVIAHEDVSDLMLAEEALRDSEERFRLTFHQSPIGAAIMSLDGRVLQCNGELARITGYPPDELIGMHSARISHPDDLDADMGPRRQLVEGEMDGYEIDMRLIRKDGAIVWIHLSMGLLKDRDGQPMFLLPTMQDITARKRAEMELADRNKELSVLSRRLVEVQEAERKRIAAELHDEIGQILTGIKLVLESRGDAPGAGSSPEQDAALEQVLGLMARVRDLSVDLRPPILDDMGLLPTIEWHVERFSRQTGVQVDVRSRGMDGRFGSAVEIAVYRIVQEALTNVARHARAGAATVVLWADDEALMVQVEDEGQGFDSRLLESTDRSGVSGMRERAALLGGFLMVDTSPGSGTTVIARIPLRTDAIARNGESP